jgi:hypothetical protein
MNFIIDEAFFTSVNITTERSLLSGEDPPTEEDTIKVLKGYDKMVSYHSEDHPEFKKLRNELEDKGFIHTERNWWNGDVVLQEFLLNGFRFRKGDQFPCACAMAAYLKFHK